MTRNLGDFVVSRLVEEETNSVDAEGRAFAGSSRAFSLPAPRASVFGFHNRPAPVCFGFPVE